MQVVQAYSRRFHTAAADREGQRRMLTQNPKPRTQNPKPKTLNRKP